MNPTRRLLLALCLCFAGDLAFADYDAVSSRGVDLSGHWRLNAASSDDAEQMLQDRLEEERKRREKFLRQARERGGIWLPPPGEEEPAGQSSPQGQRTAPPSPGAAMRKRRDDELRKMLGISDTLDITQSGSSIGIDSQVDARRFEAGTRSQVSMPQGELADSNVGWDGDWFVIERRVKGGPRVTEKYRIVKKTGQLEARLVWGGDTILSGIKVRRIYDRATPGTVAPPDPAQGPVR